MNSSKLLQTPQNALAWGFFFIAWVIALTSTLGALFMGEVMGLTPCVLCWYQRIAMFPLALLLGMGLLLRDASSARYAIALAAIGWAIAAYHCLVYWGVVPESLAPCGQGTSCKNAQVAIEGLPSIPLMSLVSFSIILASLTLALRRFSK